MRVRKRPVEVEAVQYIHENEEELLHFLDGAIGWHMGANGIEIPTAEGIMTAMPGDYIIKGVNGEFYPCKADIFEKTYDVVEGESNVHGD